MSTRSDRGIGVEGIVGPEASGELAELAESCSYGSFWINVLGAGVDPIGCLQQSLARTRDIEIGVGLFPLDKYPAGDIAPRLAAIGASNPRVILGIAAGQMKQGVLQATAEAAVTLHAALPDCKVATGGYGPKMLELGGEAADAILANWLTPERLGWLIEQVETGARRAGRAMPPIYLYHRAANGSDAVDRLRRELLEYRRYPVHEKHQASMGNPEWIGVASDDPSDIPRQLALYSRRCKVVLKPLPYDGADLHEWRSLVRYFAPVN